MPKSSDFVFKESFQDYDGKKYLSFSDEFGNGGADDRYYFGDRVPSVGTFTLGMDKNTTFKKNLASLGVLSDIAVFGMTLATEQDKRPERDNAVVFWILRGGNVEQKIYAPEELGVIHLPFGYPIFKDDTLYIENKIDDLRMTFFFKACHITHNFYSDNDGMT